MPFVEPIALRDVFELLISVYEINPAGQTLVDWLKTDWQLFSHPAMDVAHARELLSDILDDGDIVRKSSNNERQARREDDREMAMK